MRMCFISVMLASLATAATTNYVVQVNADGTQTIPPNTIATPAQVSTSAEESALTMAAATNAAAAAALNAGRVALYSSNYVVTSTVYVQSVGGVPYDPSNQTVRVYSVDVSDSEVVIVGTVRQTPLVTPTLDWRVTLGAGGVWSNIAATVQSVAVPAGVTNAVAAYRFTLERPGAGTSAYFRIVDNSTGASGSGLWWIVFGGIWVDGHKGYTGDVTVSNETGLVTLPYHGGILTDPVPLGGL